MIRGSLKASKKAIEKKSRKVKRRNSKYPATSLEQYENRCSKAVIQKFYFPIPQQLSILLTREPKNDFYLSLQHYAKNKSLTKGQMQRIIKDFDSKIRMGENYKKL